MTGRTPAIGLVLLCGAFLAHVAWWDFVSDDAFIALRYVENWKAGLGLVFNPGERVEGFTSPLWILLLGGCSAIVLDLLRAARALGMVFGVLTLVAAGRLADGLREPGESRSWTLFAPLLLAANGSHAAWAGAGLETSLFACLCTASLAETVRERMPTAALLAGLAAVARPEGVLIVAVVLAFALRTAEGRSLRRAATTIALAVVPVAAMLVFRVAYYGELLPNTYYAKTGGGVAQLARGLVYFSRYAADHEGLALLLATGATLAIRSDARRRAVVAAAVALWAAAIQVGGDGLPMYRFAVPILPLMSVLLGSLLAQLVSGRPALGRILVPALCLGLVVVHFSPPGTAAYRNLVVQRDQEIPSWTAAGRWLRENAAPGESLAVVPIGAVSYYSGLIAIDMLGLTDRHIARSAPADLGRGWAGHERHDGAYVLDRRPTYLLLGNIDLSRAPRDPATRPFIPMRTPSVVEREGDIFADPRLETDYRPRSAEIASGLFLNFYELDPAYRDR